jgi:antitoxin Phd
MAKSRRKRNQGVSTGAVGSTQANAPSWQIQTAKARFSEVFRRARTEGPQLITRQGKEGVVMISDEQYELLVGKAHQPKSIVQFFRESPLVGVELNLEREKDEGRDIEL